MLGDEVKLDSRFESLWKDKYKTGSLSTLISIIPEDRVRIKIVNNNAKVYVTVKNESDKDLHLSMDSITIGENTKSIDVEVAIGGGERQDNILTIKGISKISDLYDKHTGTILIRDMNNTDDVQKIDYINKF